MATFPQLGQRRIARDPRGISSYDVSAEGKAIEGLGNTMMRDAASRIEFIQAEAERERRQAEHERKVEQKQSAEAADRVAQITAHGAAENGLIELQRQFSERILKGEIGRDQVGQEWQAASGEIISKVMPSLPERLRPELQARLGVLSGKLDRGLNEALGKRDQQAVGSGLIELREQMQRLAVTDMDGATARWNLAVDNLGAKANWTPEQMAREKQAFSETTQYTRAYSMATGARNSNPALDAVAAELTGPQFAAMDPQRKAQLLNTIEGFKASNIQKVEAAERRVLAKQEAGLRRAEAEFTAASTLVNSGKMLSDEYVQKLTASTAGTPFAAAVPELLKQAPAATAFGSQPVRDMDRTINGLRGELNSRGTDPKTEKQLRELESIRDAARRDYKEDPLPAALERGVLPAIAPLDVSSIASITAGLSGRVEQAQIVATRTGAPVSPLLRSEAEQVAKLISVLPVDQRADAIAELAQAAGPGSASAIGQQIASKDKALGLAFGMGGAKTTAGRYTATLILRGGQAIKDKGVKEDNAALTGVRAQVSEAIGDAYTNDEVRQAMIDAAVLTNYGLQAEGSGDIGQAVRLVTGGITERNGKKLPLPYGITEPEFDKRLRAVTGQTIAPQLPDGQVYIDGKPMAADAFAAQVPVAVLVNAGQGRYAVQAGRGLVTNKAGRPVVLEMR
jgi:hypothetical protein